MTPPRTIGGDTRRRSAHPALSGARIAMATGGARCSSGGDRSTPQAVQQPRFDEGNEVFVFLKSAGLEQYALCFLRSGFDDMETLEGIDDVDLRDMGIPALHIMRLRRRLQESQHLGVAGASEHDPKHPVVVFLEDAGLGQYAKPLLRHGFDDMDTLYDVEDADLKDVGLPRGHVLKLRKRLREYQLHQYMQVETLYASASLNRSVMHTPHHLAQSSLPVSAMKSAPTAQMRSTVERSWDQVQVLGTYAVAKSLYRNTFRIMPDAVHLFPPQVRSKYAEWSSDETGDESNIFDSPALRKLFSKFINAVGCAVAGLHDTATLVPMLMQLGRRHLSYGVGAPHFQTLGRAFNLTLAEILGDDFSQEVAAAWTMAFNFMSSIMLEGLQCAMLERAVSTSGDRVSLSNASTRLASDADDLSTLSAADLCDSEPSSNASVCEGRDV